MRTTEFNIAGDDGRPIVVTNTLSIDFCGATITLKGVTGGNRMVGQAISGGLWLGGFLYLRGNFDPFVLENVVVDGGFAGSTTSNADSNVSDKGFCCQDTMVWQIRMCYVELRNFAGEMY